MTSSGGNPEGSPPPARKLIATVCIAGCLVSIGAAIAIPMILIPVPARSEFFSLKVGWLGVLASLCWLSIAGFALPITALGRFGFTRVSPALLLSVVCYSIASASLLGVRTLLPGCLPPHIHLTAQVVLFVLIVLAVLLLILAVLFAPRKPLIDS